MNRSKSVPLVATLTLVAASPGIAADATATVPPEPLALLDEARNIAACGVRLRLPDGSVPAAVDVLLKRSGETAELVLQPAPASGVPTSALRLDLDTASVPGDAVFGPGSEPDGSRAGPASKAEVTAFLRDLMVSGGMLTITGRAGEVRRILVPGPMPAATRAAYLNCAGDLYRPEE